MQISEDLRKLSLADLDAAGVPFSQPLDPFPATQPEPDDEGAAEQGVVFEDPGTRLRGEAIKAVLAQLPSSPEPSKHRPCQRQFAATAWGHKWNRRTPQKRSPWQCHHRTPQCPQQRSPRQCKWNRRTPQCLQHRSQQQCRNPRTLHQQQQQSQRRQCRNRRTPQQRSLWQCRNSRTRQQQQPSRWQCRNPENPKAFN